MSKHYTSVISGLFGKFANKEFSPPVQGFINKSYVNLMGLDMSKFKEPSEYPTLNALFTRSFVKEPELSISSDQSIISPCDALVTEHGKVADGQVYQIKGMGYDLSTLLGANYVKSMSKLEGGEYVNLYLSPKDYHRYHIPFDLSVKSVTHFPGKLYPVNMPLLKKKLNLFIENERVVIECEDNRGRTHFMVLVGALNVGKMVVAFEPRVSTNSDATSVEHYEYNPAISQSRAELFGWFEMGSTILMFSAKDAAKYSVQVDQKVSFGDEIGELL